MFVKTWQSYFKDPSLDSSFFQQSRRSCYPGRAGTNYCNAKHCNLEYGKRNFKSEFYLNECNQILQRIKRESGSQEGLKIGIKRIFQSFVIFLQFFNWVLIDTPDRMRYVSTRGLCNQCENNDCKGENELKTFSIKNHKEKTLTSVVDNVVIHTNWTAPLIFSILMSFESTFDFIVS